MFECMSSFWSNAQLNTRIIEPKDPWQNFGRETCSHGPTIRLAQGTCEILTILQAHRCLVLRVKQQVVLSQEAREEQTVPLLVGTLLDQQFGVAAELSQLRP